MPGTELVSRSSELIDYVASLKCRFSSFSSLLQDALMTLNCSVVVTHYNSSTDGDLESGAIKGKAVHPVMWYSFTYIVRQLFPTEGFRFVLKPPQTRINNCAAKPPNETQIYTPTHSDSFVDLQATKFRHRLKLRSYGQKHVPKLLSPQSRFKKSPQMTGDQLSNYTYPPESRGENFRKWILVMENFFPNRSTYMKAAKAQRAATAPLNLGPGPKTGVLTTSRARQFHTHLRYT